MSDTRLMTVLFRKETEVWHGAHQRDKGRLFVIASQLRWTSKSVEWYVGTSSSFRAVMARPMRHMLMYSVSSIAAADGLQSFLSDVKTFVFSFSPQLRIPKPHAVGMHVFFGTSLRSRDIHQEPPFLASCTYVVFLKDPLQRLVTLRASLTSLSPFGCQISSQTHMH